MKHCCARYISSLTSCSPAFRPNYSSILPRARLLSRPGQRAIGRATMATSHGNYAELPKELSTDTPDDVLFSSLYGVRTVELNRPKKLNSLDASMIRKIMPRLKEWEKSQMANVIIMSGAGEKALCAGGDVAALAKQNKTPEGQQASSDYFALEYQLDQLIATYSKPYIAMMDGITMGGGVGLSVHAPFRIATEKTVFAMPETTIGFFPDVGGSFFLPRLDGEIGTYLALTSERLHGVQAYYAGVATHYLDSSVLPNLTTRLSELVFKDYASLDQRLKLIDLTIREFTSDLPAPDSYPSAKHGNLTGSLRVAIDRNFKFETVEEILDALTRESQSTDPSCLPDWASQTLKTIQQRSPTSLKVTLRQLRIGPNWNISETFIREHQIASHFMAHPDFTEGVTALLVDKPKRQPKWTPPDLSSVSTNDVNEFFRLSPNQQQHLKFLQPHPNARSQTYTDYPHAFFALPRESDIEAVVRSHGSRGTKAIVEEVLRRWEDKDGVSEKVADVLSRKTTSHGEDGVVWRGAEARM